MKVRVDINAVEWY